MYPRACCKLRRSVQAFWTLGILAGVGVALAPFVFVLLDLGGASLRFFNALVLPPAFSVYGFRRGEAIKPPLAEPAVLEFPADGRTAEDVLGVVVVPGNPGIPQFYSKFAQDIQEELLATRGLQSHAYVLGYPNFPTGAPRVGPVARIDKEAARLGAAVERLAARHGKEGLVLVGQSIGAWCVLRHIREVLRGGSDNAGGKGIVAVVLATPFLEYDEGQAMLGRLCCSWWGHSLAGLVANFLVALPRFVQAFCAVDYGGIVREEDVEAVLQTFGRFPHHLESMVAMAKSEFELLVPNSSTNGFAVLQELLQDSRFPPVLALYARVDMWAPWKHAERMRGMLSRGRGARSSVKDYFVDLGDMKHSFCLVPDQSRQVAKHVVTFLDCVQIRTPAAAAA